MNDWFFRIVLLVILCFILYLVCLLINCIPRSHKYTTGIVLEKFYVGPRSSTSTSVAFTDKGAVPIVTTSSSSEQFRVLVRLANGHAETTEVSADTWAAMSPAMSVDVMIAVGCLFGDENICHIKTKDVK